MPETPDFDQIARRLSGHLELEQALKASSVTMPIADYEKLGDVLTVRIAELLRQAWNARGAADVEQLEFEFESVRIPASADLVMTFRRALQRLDH